ncbi:hypothetical protein V491_09051 [Pseudogymnoascus sp. VKM F-3775]|nr:hypothetical protein V491_09051 [Pseudogymnoascus sp. VKM F-3775]
MFGATIKSNALGQFDVDISTGHRVIGNTFAAVAFLTHLDKTYSTQVFDAALSPATAIPELLSLISPLARADNNPVMRYSGSLVTLSRSEGVDGITAPLPIVIGDEGANAASELMWFDRPYIQGKLGKLNLLLQTAKT